MKTLLATLMLLVSVDVATAEQPLRQEAKKFLALARSNGGESYAKGKYGAKCAEHFAKFQLQVANADKMVGAEKKMPKGKSQAANPPQDEALVQMATSLISTCESGQ